MSNFKRALAVAALLFASIFPHEMQAQVAPALTAGLVMGGLNEALGQLRSALDEATSDAKSVGNSYQANAQNVISDINQALGDKLSLTFDKLTDQQKQLVQNGARLIALTKEATDDLTKKNFDRARVLMIEGDMVAYNTSYSLPCRTTKPRIMLVEPAAIDADADTASIRLRGNFLLQGKTLSISVGGRAAEVTQRTDDEIDFTVPQAILDQAKKKQLIVTASVNGLVKIDRNIRFFLGCHESQVKLDPIPSVQFIVNPPITYHVAGTLVTTQLSSAVIKDFEGDLSRTGNDNCDDSFSVDENYCLAAKTGTFDHVDISNQSANCGSGIGPVKVSGDHCVFVGAHVQGCGAVRGPFHTWISCKGRGWVKYHYVLWRKNITHDNAMLSKLLAPLSFNLFE